MENQTVLKAPTPTSGTHPLYPIFGAIRGQNGELLEGYVRISFSNVTLYSDPETVLDDLDDFNLEDYDYYELDPQNANQNYYMQPNDVGEFYSGSIIVVPMAPLNNTYRQSALQSFGTGQGSRHMDFTLPLKQSTAEEQGLIKHKTYYFNIHDENGNGVLSDINYSDFIRDNVELIWDGGYYFSDGGEWRPSDNAVAPNQNDKNVYVYLEDNSHLYLGNINVETTVIFKFPGYQDYTVVVHLNNGYEDEDNPNPKIPIDITLFEEIQTKSSFTFYFEDENNNSITINSGVLVYNNGEKTKNISNASFVTITGNSNDLVIVGRGAYFRENNKYYESDIYIVSTSDSSHTFQLEAKPLNIRFICRNGSYRIDNRILTVNYTDNDNNNQSATLDLSNLNGTIPLYPGNIIRSFTLPGFEYDYNDNRNPQETSQNLITITASSSSYTLYFTEIQITYNVTFNVIVNGDSINEYSVYVDDSEITSNNGVYLIPEGSTVRINATIDGIQYNSDPISDINSDYISNPRQVTLTQSENSGGNSGGNSGSGGSGISGGGGYGEYTVYSKGWHHVPKYAIPWFRNEVIVKYVAKDVNSGYKENIQENIKIGTAVSKSPTSNIMMPVALGYSGSEDDEGKEVLKNDGHDYQVNKLIVPRQRLIDGELYNLILYLYQECCQSEMFVKVDKLSNLELHTFMPVQISLKHRTGIDENGVAQYEKYSESNNELTAYFYPEELTQDSLKFSYVGGNYPVFKFNLTSNDIAKYPHLYIVPTGLEGEEIEHYDLLSAVYDNVILHRESYTFAPVQDYINEYIYGMLYSYIPIGKFEYTFTQDDKNPEKVNLNNNISYIPKFNVTELNSQPVKKCILGEDSINVFLNSETSEENENQITFTENGIHTIKYYMGIDDNSELDPITIDYTVVSYPLLTVYGFKYNSQAPTYSVAKIVEDEEISIKTSYYPGASDNVTAQLYAVIVAPNERLNDIKLGKNTSSTDEVTKDDNTIYINSNYFMSSKFVNENATEENGITITYTSNYVDGEFTWDKYSTGNTVSVSNTNTNVLGYAYQMKSDNEFNHSSYSYTYLTRIIDKNDVIVSYHTNNGNIINDTYTSSIYLHDDNRYRLYNGDEISFATFSERWKLDEITSGISSLYNGEVSSEGIAETKTIDRTLSNSIAASFKNVFLDGNVSTYLPQKLSNSMTLIPYLHIENGEDNSDGDDISILSDTSSLEEMQTFVHAKVNHSFIFDEIYKKETTEENQNNEIEPNVNPNEPNNDTPANEEAEVPMESFVTTYFCDPKKYLCTYIANTTGNKHVINTNYPDNDICEKFINDWIDRKIRLEGNIDNWEEDKLYDWYNVDDRVVKDEYIDFYYTYYLEYLNGNESAFTYENVRRPFADSTQDMNYYNVFIYPYENEKLYNETLETPQVDYRYKEYVLYTNSAEVQGQGSEEPQDPTNETNNITLTEVAYASFREYIDNYIENEEWQSAYSYAVSMSYIMGFTYSYISNNIIENIYQDGFYKLGEIEYPENDFYPYIFDGNNFVNGDEYSTVTASEDYVFSKFNIQIEQDEEVEEGEEPVTTTTCLGDIMIREGLSNYTNYVKEISDEIIDTFAIHDVEEGQPIDHSLTFEDITTIFEEDSFSFGYDNETNVYTPNELEDFITLHNLLNEYNLFIKGDNSNSEYIEDNDDKLIGWLEATYSFYNDFLAPFKSLNCSLSQYTAESRTLAYENYNTENALKDEIKSNNDANTYFEYLAQNNYYRITYISYQAAEPWGPNDFSIWYAQNPSYAFPPNVLNDTDKEQWYSQNYTTLGNKTPEIQEQYIYFIAGQQYDVNFTHWNTNIFIVTAASTSTSPATRDCSTNIEGLFALFVRYINIFHSGIDDNEGGYVINDTNQYIGSLATVLYDLGIQFTSGSSVTIPTSAINSFLTYFSKYYKYIRYMSNIDDNYTEYYNSAWYLTKSEENNVVTYGYDNSITLPSFEPHEIEYLNRFGYEISLLLDNYSNKFNEYITNIYAIKEKYSLEDKLIELTQSIENFEVPKNFIPASFDDFEIIGVKNLIDIYQIVDYIFVNGPKLLIKKHLQRAQLYGLYRSYNNENYNELDILRKSFGSILSVAKVREEIIALQNWLKNWFLDFAESDDENLRIKFGDSIIKYNRIEDIGDDEGILIHRLLCNGYNIYIIGQDLYLTQSGDGQLPENESEAPQEGQQEQRESEFNLRYVINNSPNEITKFEDIYQYDVKMFNGSITINYDDITRLNVDNSKRIYLHILVYYNNAFFKEVNTVNKEIYLVNKIFNINPTIHKVNGKFILDFNYTENIVDAYIDQTKNYELSIDLKYMPIDGDGYVETSQLINDGESFIFNSLSLAEEKLYIFAYRVKWTNLNNINNLDECLYSEWNYLVAFVSADDEYSYYVNVNNFDSTWINDNLNALECRLFAKTSEGVLGGDSTDTWWYYYNSPSNNEMQFQITYQVNINGEEGDALNITPNLKSNYEKYSLNIETTTNKYELTKYYE